MNPEERAGRAFAVKALLDDPKLRAAFPAIDADLVAEWRRCFDPRERENLWRAVNIMERLQAWLRSAASHGPTALRRQK
jgi:hypothetical protein